MSFSADNQLLLTLGGAPDWTLVCWNWNKAKVLSYVQVSESSPVSQTSFSPLDASVACVSGKDKLSFYRKVPIPMAEIVYVSSRYSARHPCLLPQLEACLLSLPLAYGGKPTFGYRTTDHHHSLFTPFTEDTLER